MPPRSLKVFDCTRLREHGPDVFFDDFTIEYKENSLIQTTTCYPYGMTAYTWMRDAEIPNRYGFQGKEWEDKTQWYDFHARQYDPVLGRWFALDPGNQFASGYMGMGDNPIMGIDPDGNFFLIIPQISYSKEGGLSIGISVVFGIPGAASAQVGVGYNFKSKNWSAYAAGSLMFNTVSLSYSSGSGWKGTPLASHHTRFL